MDFTFSELQEMKDLNHVRELKFFNYGLDIY